MSRSFSRPSLGRLLSQSIFGTALVLVGGAVFLVGSLYGIALGVIESFSTPPTGPTPAGISSPFSGVVIVLLLGVSIIALGGYLRWYFG